MIAKSKTQPPKPTTAQTSNTRLRDDLKARPHFLAMRQTCGVKVRPTFNRGANKPKVETVAVPVVVFKAYTSPTPREAAWLKFRAGIESEIRAVRFEDHCRID